MFRAKGFFHTLPWDRVDAQAARCPAGTSVQNVIHWFQIGLPLYNVKDVKMPMAIWSGGVDCLADPWDIALLLAQVHYKVIPQWNHLDFLPGLDATEVLYQEIIDMMKKHL